MLLCFYHPFRLPARWPSGFSGDHQQNYQCLWYPSCAIVTHVCCPSMHAFCWEHIYFYCNYFRDTLNPGPRAVFWFQLYQRLLYKQYLIRPSEALIEDLNVIDHILIYVSNVMNWIWRKIDWWPPSNRAQSSHRLVWILISSNNRQLPW